EGTLGPTALFTLQFKRTRARALAEEGRLDEAEALARATLAQRQGLMTDWVGNGRTRLYLGRILVEQGKLDEAEPQLQAALKIFHEHSPVKPELAPQAQNWLGAIELVRKHYSEA